MLEEEILLNKQNLSNYHIDNKIFQPSIKIPEEIFIPENYIDDLDLRLSIYKRISNLYNIDDLSNLIIELIDRFGNIPKQLQNLFSLIEIKLLCIKYNIDQFEFSRKGIVIGFYKKRPLNPNKIFNLSMIKNTQYILRPDQKIFYDFKGVLNENRFNLSKKILKEIN